MQLRLYTEVGGFGAGSDFTWQVFPDAEHQAVREGVAGVWLSMAGHRLRHR